MSKLSMANVRGRDVNKPLMHRSLIQGYFLWIAGGKLGRQIDIEPKRSLGVVATIPLHT